MNDAAIISDPAALLATLLGVCALFFLIERKSQWRLFDYFPPLLWIFIVPLILSNIRWIPTESPVYDQLSDILLPVVLVLLLMDVDVIASVRVLGKGILIGMFGTIGIVVGAPAAAFLFRDVFEPGAWKSLGVLTGSMIGGTGNMAAVADGLNVSGTQFGLAMLANDVIYLVWLPILIWSKQIAKWFNRFANVSSDYTERIRDALAAIPTSSQKIEMRHIIFLLAIGLSITALAGWLTPWIPEFGDVLTSSTYRILLVTTLAVLLSLTPLRGIPGSQPLSMALLYLFVASMGARADLAGLAGQAPWFILAGLVCLVIHGLFTLAGAKILHVDVHITAISSAALIGGVASAPVVAAHHHPRYASIAILMALIGYSVGNYAAFFAAYLSSLAAP